MFFMFLHSAVIYSLCYTSPCIALSLCALRRTPCTSSGTTGSHFKRKLASNAAFLVGETIPVEEFASLSSAATLPLDWDLWHCRLCHSHLAGIKKLLSGNLPL